MVDPRAELTAFASGLGEIAEHKKGRTGWEDSITVVPAEGAARAWAAFGLRPVSGGYELVRVDMKGNEVADTTALRQPEPQRGIAFDYLDAEIAEEYLRYKY